MIQTLHNRDIDKNRWDNLVHGSSNPFVYALSYYLDCTCPDWEGLILNDYEAVFPLPVKKKFFLSYLVQPILSQQYDIYSCRNLSENEVSLFRSKITQYVSIRLCLSKPLFDGAIQRHNYCLNLEKPYEELSAAYTENTKRNIKKAQGHSLICSKAENKDACLDCFFSLDKRNLYVPYRNQIKSLVRQSEIEAYMVKGNGKVLSVALFFKTVDRLYYMLPISTEVGKQTSAMFMLLDFVIRKYAGTKFVVDFEGSELLGVRRFYEGFGALNVPYYYYEHHSLPLIGKIVKK